MNGLKGNVEQVGTGSASGGNEAARTMRYNVVPLAFLAMIAGVLFLFNPSQYHFYPVCFFHEVTGLLCPGCGALRAMHQLLHGHLAAAFHFNPLLVLALPFLFWMGVRLIARNAEHQSPSVALRPFWIWALFAVVVVFGVLRNLPFAWLGQ